LKVLTCRDTIEAAAPSGVSLTPNHAPFLTADQLTVIATIGIFFDEDI
jgi:hypothetical protein